MTRREAILAMKARIKEWSAYQKELRQLDRLPYRTPEQKEAWPKLKEAFKKKHGITSEWWHPGSALVVGKARITAALNLYHELRGKPHCHGISQPAKWMYPNCLRELREEFAYEEVVAVA